MTSTLKGKNAGSLIGEERLDLILRDNISQNERFNYYLKLQKKEPKAWEYKNHLQRLYGDCFIINFNIYIFYKIYYGIGNPSLRFIDRIKTSKSFYFIISALLIFDFFTLKFNYIDLQKKIFLEHYSHLPDKDFIKLYNHIMNPEYKYFVG